MTKRTVRSALAIGVLIATIIVFAWYFVRHPEVFQALRRVSPATILVLFILYAIFMLTLVWIQRATLQLCGVYLERKESVLLTVYSSIINFFGPLQSGPAFRGAYIKKRHNANLKQYALATLAYYGFYALFSGLLLLAFVAGRWVIAGCLLAIALAPLIKQLRRFQAFNIRPLLSLALATLSQVAVLAVIYYVELRSLQPGVGFGQVLVYTGAANFALFVSLTPGAIGFRESFLLFSMSLHHISSSVIAIASIIDRSVYILTLLLMALFVFGTHANDYLKNRLATPAATDKPS